MKTLGLQPTYPVTDVASARPVVADPIIGMSPVWLALWTKPRAEKAVARTLESQSVPLWLPTMRVTRRWSDRLREVTLPLFPGYVFAQASADTWPALLRVRGVLTVVKHGRKPARISGREMDDLRIAVERVTSGEQTPEVIQDFVPGDRVRVVDGPMAGLAGVVREVRGSRRLLVGFEQIGRGLSVSIGAASVTMCVD
jgi:transcription antitermination factor NusG